MNFGLRLEDVREEVLNLLGHSIDKAPEAVIVSPDTSLEYLNQLRAVLETVQELDRQIQELMDQKTLAIASHDIEGAARLRDDEHTLRNARKIIVRQAKEQPPKSQE